jgi:hypothetical protein
MTWGNIAAGVGAAAGGYLGGKGGEQTTSNSPFFEGAGYIGGDLAEALRFQFSRQQGGDIRKRNPNVFAGNQFIRDSIRGDFLDPFQNPGLQPALERGADFIKQRVNTDFAGAGRNLDAGAPVGQDALTDLTQRLTLPLFESGLNRQQQILNAVPTFDPLNIAINQFSNLASSSAGNTSIPLQGDPIAGAIGGAQVGGTIADILKDIFGGGGGGGSGSGGGGSGK